MVRVGLQSDLSFDFKNSRGDCNRRGADAAAGWPVSESDWKGSSACKSFQQWIEKSLPVLAGMSYSAFVTRLGKRYSG